MIPIFTNWIMLAPNRLAIMNYGILYFIITVIQTVIRFFSTHQHFKINAMFKEITILKIIMQMLLNIILIFLSFKYPNIIMVLYLLLSISSFLIFDGPFEELELHQ